MGWSSSQGQTVDMETEPYHRGDVTGCGVRPLISFLGSLWFIIASVAHLRNMESIEPRGSVFGSSEGSKTAVKFNKNRNNSHGVFHEYKFSKYIRRQGFIVA